MKLEKKQALLMVSQAIEGIVIKWGDEEGWESELIGQYSEPQRIEIYKYVEKEFYKIEALKGK